MKDVIIQAFDSMELFFRGITNPAVQFQRDPSQRKKEYPLSYTAADQEFAKTSRRKPDPSKHGNPARSLSLLGPRGKVFVPVGGGILKSNLKLLAVYPTNIRSGFGPKHEHRKSPEGHDIEKGLEETKAKFKTAAGLDENPEAIANIKTWDCILYILDPVEKSFTTPTQRFLEAVFLRDVYAIYFEETLPIYSISLENNVCKKIGVNDEYIILAHLKLYQEKIENDPSGLANSDPETWLYDAIQRSRENPLNTHYSSDLKNRVRERLIGHRTRMLRSSIKKNLSLMNLKMLSDISNYSSDSRKLVEACVQVWAQQELKNLESLFMADQIYSIITHFSANPNETLNDSFLLILKNTIKQFINSNLASGNPQFTELSLLSSKDLIQLMVDKSLIKFEGNYTRSFHDGLVNRLVNDPDFKIETLTRKALEGFQFASPEKINTPAQIDSNISILQAMIFYNIYQSSASNLFLAIFDDLLNKPASAEKRTNILLAIISNENIPLYQSLLVDTFSDWRAANKIYHQSYRNDSVLKDLSKQIERNKKMHPKFQ